VRESSADPAQADDAEFVHPCWSGASRYGSIDEERAKRTG
jgi:hypothetical protein